MATTLGYLLKQAQYLYRQRLDEALRPLDLTAAQYGALSALERLPEATNAALARTCFVTPQTMIQIVGGLSRRGLVRRRADPRHGRRIQTDLTPDGVRLLAAGHQVVGTIDERAFAPLPDADQLQLTRLLEACVRNLDAADQDDR